MLATLALTGCASSSGPTAPEQADVTPAPSAPVGVSDIVPVTPEQLTAETAAAEGTRVADAIQALIDPALIVNVDAQSEVVTKSTGVGRYFATIRAITLDPSTDAIGAATDIVTILHASGWIDAETRDGTEMYVSRAVSSTDPATAWFLSIGGDASVPGESAISLQLASPDIP